MAEPAHSQASYADLEKVPANLVAEILHGTLVTHPRPSPRHGVASNVLGAELTSGFQHGRGGPGGWIFIDEPELHLGPHVVVPDIAGWRRERLSSLPDTAWIETPPDWVSEVLSPSTEYYDRGAKREIYAEAGVGYLWFVDPLKRNLEAFQLVAGKWMLLGFIGGGDDVRLPPFDAVSFSLALLWPFDPPSDASEPPKS